MEVKKKTKIRVAIVEDEKPIRLYLEKMVKEDLANSCVFDFSVGSYEEFLLDEKPNEYNPDVILLDMHLGEGNPSGMSIVEYFRKRRKNIPKILVVSTYLNEFVVEMNKQSGIVRGCIKKSVILKNGAVFLEKQLKRAVNPKDTEFIVFLDNTPVYLPQAAREKYVKKLPNKITVIQKQLLDGLEKGGSYATIAKNLGRNENTLRNHGKTLRKKLNVETTVQLLAKAKELGFLSKPKP